MKKCYSFIGNRGSMFLALVLLVGLIFVQGCAEYQLRLEDTKESKTPYDKTTFHAYLWGKIIDPTQVTADCHPKVGINDVIIKRNYLHDLASVFTFGLWMPMDVEYRCQSGPKKRIHVE